MPSIEPLSTRYFIGIDDTDNRESRGTGYRARTLGAQLEEKGLAILEGVTRHQLLVSPAIPYTSHNSAACYSYQFNQRMQFIKTSSACLS
ncbi:hypothetical protein [Nitrosococcus halophilus]|uniref:hypothetical protein n=1 Tax=Nitrosococcus halophilus TaxID=133539 RepID=UPI0003134FDD|nr:hypothetical protein [Nitrosococcus halophilus]